ILDLQKLVRVSCRPHQCGARFREKPTRLGGYKWRRLFAAAPELLTITIVWQELSSTRTCLMVNAHGHFQRIRTPITLALAKNNECRGFQGVFEIDHKFVIAVAVKSQFEVLTQGAGFGLSGDNRSAPRIDNRAV